MDHDHSENVSMLEPEPKQEEGHCTPLSTLSQSGLNRIESPRAPSDTENLGQKTSTIEHSPAMSRKTKRASTTKSGFTWWLFESAASILATALLITLVAILNNADGQDQLHQGRYLYGQLTLNGLVALLTTLMKSAMMVSVAAALSQLKWNWITQQSRLLRDIEVFDDASRGPWGSARLIFSKIGLHLGVLGAIITIAALALDTFAQQVVEIRYRPTRDVNGTSAPPILRSEMYNEYIPGGSPSPTIPALLADYQGQMNDGQIKTPVIQCPTSRCDWPIVPTLALCGSCTNITSLIGANCPSSRVDCSINIHDAYGKNSTFTIPKNGTLPVGTSIFGRTPFVDSLYNEGDQQYVDQFLIYDILDPRYSSAQFHSCGTWLCMQAHNISVNDGQQSESVVATWNKTVHSTTKTWANFTDVPQEAFNIPINTTYGMSVNSIKAWIHPYETSDRDYIYPLNTSVLAGGASSDDYSTDTIRYLFNVTDYNAWMQQYTLSMTNHIRTAGTSATDPTYYAGSVYSSEPYVHIRWPWLAFPAAIVVASTLLLALTIWQTSRRRVRHWKGSALALLHCTVDEELLIRAPRSEDLTDERALLLINGQGATLRGVL